MSKDNSGLSQVRKIDNAHLWMPFVTTIFLVALIALLVWFFRGGSFRLYASVFFLYYHFTHQIWLSVILIGITQNVIFLPLRFISLKLSLSLKDFEDELEKMNSEKDQYFLFSQKVKGGNVAVIFYIFNFVLNALAFFSAGRIFLLDFYSQKLDPKYLYNAIPYPDYPLLGTNFRFPFFKITSTTALDWFTIFRFWLIFLAVFVAFRVLWRLFRFLFKKNKKILSLRINYNRLLLKVGGIGGTLFLLSLFIFRHLPSSFEGLMLLADLTRANSTMNLITAVGTFLTTLHAGYIRHNLSAKQARRENIPDDIIDRVFRQRMKQSFQNALILGIGAYGITSQIPSAFELSVATFEVLYILSPYTFDLLLRRPAKINPPPVSSEITA